MDHTLIDFGPLYAILPLFFTHNEVLAGFEEFQETAWAHFKAELFIRDWRLMTIENTTGCLFRPDVIQALYELKGMSGFAGGMILSNNTMRELVDMANEGIQNIGTLLEIEGADDGPIFDEALLLHHGHTFRREERNEQRRRLPTRSLRRNGGVINNTFKSLHTVKRAFEAVGDPLGVTQYMSAPSAPYSLVEPEESVKGIVTLKPEQLEKTANVIFADDLSGQHQLQYELFIPDIQFIHCSPFRTECVTTDLYVELWKAFSTAAADLFGEENSIAKQNQYFQLLTHLGVMPLPAGAPNAASTNEKKELLRFKTALYTRIGMPTATPYKKYVDAVNWKERFHVYHALLQKIERDAATAIAEMGGAGTNGVKEGGSRRKNRRAHHTRRKVRRFTKN